MLGVLGLVDVVMIANLLIMVIVGGYETFVSRIRLDDHPDQPEWLSHVNANVLKTKLAMSIIGISSIHLLRSFIEAPHDHRHRARHRRAAVADGHPPRVHRLRAWRSRGSTRCRSSTRRRPCAPRRPPAEASGRASDAPVHRQRRRLRPPRGPGRRARDRPRPGRGVARLARRGPGPGRARPARRGGDRGAVGRRRSSLPAGAGYRVLVACDGADRRRRGLASRPSRRPRTDRSTRPAARSSRSRSSPRTSAVGHGSRLLAAAVDTAARGRRRPGAHVGARRRRARARSSWRRRGLGPDDVARELRLGPDARRVDAHRHRAPLVGSI